MIKPEVIIQIIVLILFLLDSFVFYRFTKRWLKDLKYIIQICMMFLSGYILLLVMTDASKMNIWLQILAYMVCFVSFGYVLFKSIKTVVLIYTNYEPEFIVALIRYLISIVLIFALLYGIIYRFDNTSFIGIRNNNALDTYVDFVYFSFLTFTTIGFKDIAVNSLAKAIVIIEIITFYLTIGAGIKYIIHRKKEDEELTRQYFRTKQFKKNRS